MAKHDKVSGGQGYVFIARKQISPLGKNIVVPPMVVHNHAIIAIESPLLGK
jgi:hypothetical protein